jgi:hypothetical protein
MCVADVFDEIRLYLGTSDVLRTHRTCTAARQAIDARAARYAHIARCIAAVHAPKTPFTLQRYCGDPAIYQCTCGGCKSNRVCCIDMRFEPPIVYNTSVPYCSTHMYTFFPDLMSYLVTDF